MNPSNDTIHAVIVGGDQCIFPYVSGVVMNLGTTGSIDNRNQAAGICRSVRRGGAVINCYSLMELSSGSGQAGGIAASTQSGDLYLMNCYFAGVISGGNGGPICVWAGGRDGNFAYLYSPEDLGAYNVSYADVLLPWTQMNGDLANLLNSNIESCAADYNLDPSIFMKWTAGDSTPVFKR